MKLSEDIVDVDYLKVSYQSIQMVIQNNVMAVKTLDVTKTCLRINKTFTNNPKTSFDRLHKI